MYLSIGVLQLKKCRTHTHTHTLKTTGGTKAPGALSGDFPPSEGLQGEGRKSEFPREAGSPLLEVVPQFTDALLIFKSFFCVSFGIDSIAMPSSSQIFFFPVLSNLPGIQLV